MQVSTRRIHLLPGIMALGFIVIALPVLGAIVTAVWLAGAAAYENIKFARCTEQVLTIIAQAQDDAARDARFGVAAGEDIIDNLIRRGQLTQVPKNAWNGPLRVTVQPLPNMRFEMDLPSYACKRVSLYVGKHAADLKLLKMEARGDGKDWSTFYDAAIDPDTSAFPGVNAACGRSPASSIALTFRLR